MLPENVHVLARDDFVRQEINYFIEAKPIGILIKIGVIIGFVVGTAILYQIMSTEVHTRTREFATMKAPGFGSDVVYGAVLG